MADEPQRPKYERYNSVEELQKEQQSHDTFNTLAPTFEIDENDEKRGQAGDPMSPAHQHAGMTQLNDDLELLRIERMMSQQETQDDEMRRSRSKGRVHNPEPEDAFLQLTQGQQVASEKKKNEDAALYKFWMFMTKFPRFLRYIVYMLPGAALLLIPLLIGYFQPNEDDNNVGGVKLMWFGIWLEIVWCALWVSRMISNLIPALLGGFASLGGSATPKKWKDIGYQLELHFAMFLWMLANLIAFKPTTKSHRTPDHRGKEPKWIDIIQKIIIALFVLSALNFVEKIIIQWIATTFHQRTYATRIENNKGDVNQLVELFEYAKAKLEDSDAFWQGDKERISGAQTPLRALHDNARQVFGKVGYVAGRVGNDLIGRKVNVNMPRKVVGELLRTTASAHTLARLIYRAVVRDDRDTVHIEDMRQVFKTDEEADAAFGVFDKDLNGDISIEEFEAVCNEIHLEKKAIAASLKDLDSVIQKLDKVFLFIIVIIAIIVFISILSGSAAAGLASAGTSVLGLAWMLQATAQEFLQSIIFVFVKHPFDVGDRVTIYGSTGDTMTGDDYYVTEISLLYTEFKKMQGHIVQAPNSVLNTLFILNQRRSNGLADVVPLEMRFGTSAEQIEDLKARMLEFCLEHKRDYQPSILSEMSSIDSLRSCKMNIVFFHKSNYQNELLRLNRHNRFVTELMRQMLLVGIQAPMRLEPGGSREHPMYWTNMPAPPAYGKEHDHGHDQDDHHGSEREGSMPPLSSLRRTGTTRSSMRSERLATGEEFYGDFQDVFENRREVVQAHRLASIREKEIAARRQSVSQGNDESEPRGSTTSARLAPTQSIDSQGRSGSRFRRGRGNTVTRKSGEEMV